MTASALSRDGQDLAYTEAIARIARERGWPDEIAHRLIELRAPLSELNSWGWFGLSPEQARAQLGWYERLTIGDLRGRDASFADNEAFSDLWSDSPEEIGEWEITVERGPDAFAQFKLQENVHIPVLALGSQLLACCAFSRRRVIIGGRRVSVQYGQALRVRRAFRRMGYGDQVRRLAAPAASSRPILAQYDIMRSQNFAVANWWQKFIPDFFDNVPKREGSVPGIPVSVAQFPSRPRAAGDPAIRPARRQDLPVCVKFINRSHGNRSVSSLHGRFSRGGARRRFLGRTAGPDAKSLARLVAKRLLLALISCSKRRAESTHAPDYGIADATCASDGAGSAARKSARSASLRSLISATRKAGRRRWRGCSDG